MAGDGDATKFVRDEQSGDEEEFAERSRSCHSPFPAHSFTVSLPSEQVFSVRKIVWCVTSTT